MRTSTFAVSIKHCFIVKVDEEEHFHLVRNITNKLITQIIKRKRIEKNGTWFYNWKSFCYY